MLKRVAEDTPRPIREIIPDVPDWLCAIIAKLHAKNPADRFASAQEVADLLKGHLAALRSSAGSPPGPRSPAAVFAARAGRDRPGVHDDGPVRRERGHDPRMPVPDPSPGISGPSPPRWSPGSG